MHLGLPSPDVVATEFLKALKLVLRRRERLQESTRPGDGVALASPPPGAPRDGDLASPAPPASSASLGQRANAALTLQHSVDNRNAWAMLLHSKMRAQFPNLSLVVRFYLSVQDNTGLLERGLGATMTLNSAHNGPMEESGESLSDLLHVYLDGPQAELDLFTRSSDGALLFTSFSRRCQEHWIATHGRRFTCAKDKRKHAALRKTAWRLLGTDTAVQAGQRCATKTLTRLAARGVSVRTFLDDATADYADGAGCGTPRPLRKFRALTKKRIRAKRLRAAGEAPPQPVELTAAPAASRQLAKSAARRRSLLAVVRDVPAMFVHGPPLTLDFEGAARLASLKVASIIVVPALEDLDTKDLTARDLLVWLVVIAAGKSLLARSASTPDGVKDMTNWLRHEVGRRYKQSVGLCEEFARAEPKLASALQEQAACDGSKWQVRLGGGWRSDREGGTVVINSLLTFQDVLRSARRIFRARSHHGTYCKRSVAPLVDP